MTNEELTRLRDNVGLIILSRGYNVPGARLFTCPFLIREARSKGHFSKQTWLVHLPAGTPPSLSTHSEEWKDKGFLLRGWNSERTRTNNELPWTVGEAFGLARESYLAKSALGFLRLG